MNVTPGIIIGYHGCTHDVAENIFTGNIEHLEPSNNEYDWIGRGIYFWENDYIRAYNWAKTAIQRKHKGKSQKPAVVGAVIIPNHCLDLITQESQSIIKSTYDAFKNELLAVGIEPKDMPKNEPAFQGDSDCLKRMLDCQVINYLHNNIEQFGGQSFDSVRAAFLEGHGIFDGSNLLDKTHIQWSIQNPKKCILGYFRPINTSHPKLRSSAEQ